MPNKSKSRTPRVYLNKIPEYIRVMTDAYGPFEPEPRLDPINEAVFTILSQHTSDINSSRAFGLLMERFGSLEAVAQGNVADIERAISPGGLARIKAPRIKDFLTRVMGLNGSLDLSFLKEMPLPEAKAWLRQLPGIGPKSAGIVLNFALGMPAMAIDTHIYRVCQRLRFIGPKVSVDKAHDILEAAVTPEQVFQFHVSMINHGRQVCKAQRPLCGECVVGEDCPSRRQIERKMMQAANGRKPATGKRPPKVSAIMPHVPAEMPVAALELSLRSGKPRIKESQP